MNKLATPEHTYVICLGGNAPAAAENIGLAVKYLESLGRCAASSPLYDSAPEYPGETVAYVNRIVELHSAFAPDHLQKLTKYYESSIRSTATSSPLVSLDIDIVIADGVVLRRRDAASAYFRAGLEMMPSNTTANTLILKPLSQK